MDERDVIRGWRELFHNGEVTSETLVQAEEFLEGLSGESPLRIRLATELAELQKKSGGQRTKKPSARRSKA
jgi:hypothetical protein